MFFCSFSWILFFLFFPSFLMVFHRFAWLSWVSGATGNKTNKKKVNLGMKKHDETSWDIIWEKLRKHPCPQCFQTWLCSTYIFYLGGEGGERGEGGGPKNCNLAPWGILGSPLPLPPPPPSPPSPPSRGLNTNKLHGYNLTPPPHPRISGWSCYTYTYTHDMIDIDMKTIKNQNWRAGLAMVLRLSLEVLRLAGEGSNQVGSPQVLLGEPSGLRSSPKLS